MRLRLFEQWAEKRLGGGQTLPARMGRRHIYILPTGSGWTLMVIALGGILVALNYNSNEALLLSLLLGGVLIGSLIAGQRALEGLMVMAVETEAGHEGEGVRVSVDIQTKPRARGLMILCDQQQATFEVNEYGRGRAEIELAGSLRGVWQVPRMTLTTRRPFGLGAAWTWILPRGVTVHVWPALEEAPPPIPPMNDGRKATRSSVTHQHDVRSLRPYRAGDPLRLIAWKPSARSGQTLVREYDRPEGQAVIDYAQLGPLSHETRLRRMATWIAEAERGGRPTLLRLPQQQIGPGRGLRHKVACLNALAEMPRG